MTPKAEIRRGAVYSKQQAAALLYVSLPTLNRMIRRGVLRASKPAGGRRVLITGESLWAMLEASETP